MRALVSLLALLLLAAPARAQELAPPALGWEPARTWVFAAGCLEWRASESFSGFPLEGRRDVELVAALRDAGVPAERVVFLKDAECTRAALDRELRALLGKTRPGDLVVFYYTGHGSQDDDGTAAFAPHDADPEDRATLWSVSDVVAAIATLGQHERALLLADCCYSGALADEARAREEGRVSFGVLASSLRTSVSTGRWTFTECLLAGLRGQGAIDADHDALVELDELARHAELTLAFEDTQLTCFTTTSRFAATTALAPVRAAAEVEAPAERVMVLWGGTWWPARVQATDGERKHVRYVGWDETHDEWVEPERLSAWPGPARPKGEAVDIQWGSRWWPGTILDHRLGLHLVHYEGFSSSWDEWVAAPRLRPRTVEEPARGR